MNIIKKVFYHLPSIKIGMVHHVALQADEFCPCVVKEQNLSAVLDGNRFIKMEDALKPVKRKADKSFVITADDALADLYTVLYPMLKARDIPFVAFVSSDMLDKKGYITTKQLMEMSKDPLITIGSHGATHVLLDNRLTDEQLWYELKNSKEKLEAIIHKKVSLFAYSNGVYDKRTIRFVKKAGFQYAFGVIPRPLNIATKLFRYNLPRYNITDNTYRSINYECF